MEGGAIFTIISCLAAAAYILYIFVEDKKGAKVRVANGLPAQGWYQGPHRDDLELQ